MDLRPETPIGNLLRNDFWGTPVHTEKSHKSFRPLAVLTFRLNFLLGDLNPFGYHLGNVAVHGLVCYFTTHLLSVVMPSLGATAVASLLFAVHPIHTESVASVVGRAEVLSALCYCLAFLCYVQAMRARRLCSAEHAVCLVLCLALALAGMLCKEGGITVLGVCFAVEVFVLLRLLRLAPPPRRPPLSQPPAKEAGAAEAGGGHQRGRRGRRGLQGLQGRPLPLNTQRIPPLFESPASPPTVNRTQHWPDPSAA